MSRLDEIIDVLVSYAQQDFSARVPVSERRDEIDAIATGINLLAEELGGEVASRRELEAAYAHLQATQAQLVVAERFAAVGQLASGVAHELNNPATWVTLGLDTARRRLTRARGLAGMHTELDAELAAVEAIFADVCAGIERMRTVVGDLRTLSRADGDAPTTVAVDELVRSACQLARPAYHSVARLNLVLGGVPAIVGDRGRLGQLVTNLVINAAYAVADAGPGHEIRVSTELDHDSIVLAVDDTGPGIPDELCHRVFEPYFTTKPAEIGSGLGLSLVRQIAEQHGGTARAMRSTLGGARVEVRIPVGRGAVPTTPSSLAPSAATQGGRARILLIDDEPMLLRALAESLRDEHEIVTAIGGVAALEIFATDHAFDLVVCDLQMPHVDGVAIHEALVARAPRLAADMVIMTGGAVTPRVTQFLQRVTPRILKKPIEIDDLRVIACAALAAR